MPDEIFYWMLCALALLAAADFIRQQKDALRLFRYLSRETREPAVDRDSLPKAAVILALRGPDPRLHDTLHALMAQDYPDFLIQVVVDSDQDPVLKEVLDAQATSGRIHVSVLRNPGNNCSLKCSSLIQAVNDLPSDVEIVAFIDGDVVPHTGWLSELAGPIVAGKADVTGGNRWYLPMDAAWGSYVRYFWNARFMREMWTQGAPWAGTMALKRTTIDRIGLLNAWSTAMSVDATLHRCLNAHQQRFKLVGSLIMTNRESISVSQFHNWVTRQMAVIRYTASHTVRSVQVHIAILLLIHLLAVSLAAVEIAGGEFQKGCLALLVLTVYWFTLSLGATVHEYYIRICLRKRGEDASWITPLKALLWFPAIILTHWVLIYGVLKSLRMTAVNWRGISYQLLSNGRVRMINYHPFAAKWSPTDNRSVI
jgi:cellulose synthase/poly-beta-1,6-N-acetylglucosamine synthase-like glycosyltransferase